MRWGWKYNSIARYEFSRLEQLLKIVLRRFPWTLSNELIILEISVRGAKQFQQSVASGVLSSPP